MEEKVAIIGGGWYGSHIALALREKGYDVALFERNSCLFSEISGLFGIRLHIGPHYPRSSSTRKSCLNGFLEFTTNYPELIVAHDHSVYAIGSTDANGQTSKVTAEEFIDICKEHSKCKVIYNTEEKGYRNLEVAVELAEPSIYIGRKLNKFFQEKLQRAGVKIFCNYEIKAVTRNDKLGIEIENGKAEKSQFDHVVNATSFQTLLPTKALNLPFEIFYQPCLALVYEDLNPTTEKPFSFIVMDGWFPCMMPAVEYGAKLNGRPRQYILTHGKWTIMASYKNVDSARAHLCSINDAFVNKEVRPKCEAEIKKFWPAFEGRFKYVKWVGSVLAKIRNNREFRSSVTFQDKDSGMIYVLPGKISNIFDATDEVTALIENDDIIHKETEGYAYVKEGMLDTASPEFEEEIKENNTCDLQTFRVVSNKNIAPPPRLLEREAPQSIQQHRRCFSALPTKQLLTAMIIFLAINEMSDQPNYAVRNFLGLAIIATSLAYIKRRYLPTFFRQFPTHDQTFRTREPDGHISTRDAKPKLA